MGGLNQDTWKQPPASLSVEWPTKSAFKNGPSLEEQKARMRETRTKVSSAIAASGFAVPRWPEIGQQVDWNPPKASLGDGLTNLAPHGGGQASSVPRRYQSSTADADTRSPARSAPQEEGRSSVNQDDSPLLQLIGRRRDRSHQPENNTPSHTLPVQDDGGLPSHIDCSFFNPRINLVQLPDHMFLRPPPAAPRAMLEHLSSQDRPLRVRRPRRHSEATETSFDSTHTRRARGYSSATSDTHHSFEPTVSDCGSQHCMGFHDSSRTDITAGCLETPNRERANSLANPEADSRHILDTPRAIGPLPGFEPHKTIHQSTTPRPGSGVLGSGIDRMNGRWSQSRNWVSEQKRLEDKFKRMREKAKHLGCDKSPFLPETIGEYADLLAEKKAAEAKRIREKILKNEKAARIRQNAEAMVSHRSQLINANCLFFGEALIDEFVQTPPQPQQQIELFNGNRAGDGLSSVLAMETCFNEIPADAPESERVDWPPEVEFRTWKSSRVRRRNSYREVWPLPRTNIPYRPEDSFPNIDIPYSQRRIIFVPRWDWMPKFAKTLPDEPHTLAVEPFMTDISALLPSDLFL